MHIVYVCNEYPPDTTGGIGTAVATLARGMNRAGHHVSVIGLYDKPRVDRDEQITVTRLPIPERNRLIKWWVSRRQLRDAIIQLHRRQPIDIIEWPDFQGFFWKPVDGVTDVVKVHGTTMSHRIHGLRKRHALTEHLELRTLRSILNWVGVSHWFNAEWKQIAGVKPRHETVVYNPVDLGVFHPIDAPRDPGLILYAGGLKRRKGVLGLAQAARIFLKDLPKARLVLVGFPSDLTEQDVRSAAGEVSRRIEFVPFMQQPELAKYLARASLFVMPSLYESCGNTWLEAGACETPVIGSILSCGPEVVLDGQTGLLTDPSNPQDIAEKIIRLMTDTEFSRHLGVTARHRVVETFSLDPAVKISQKFYDECRADRR